MSAIAIPNQLMKTVSDLKNFQLISPSASKKEIEMVSQVIRDNEDKAKDVSQYCCGVWL